MNPPGPVPLGQRKRHVSQEEAYAGPGKVLLGLPTPEQTPPSRRYKRARRTHGSSEEELPMADPTAEVVKMDDYRVGSPFLLNLPSLKICLSDDSPFYKAWIAGLERLIIDSLNKYEVDWFEISAAARRCPLRDESANETILVLAHRTKPEDKWREAVIAARKLCTSFDVPNVNVEIADERGLKPKRSSTVGDGEPVMAAWPNLESQIIEILGDTFWLAIELLRRGTNEDGSKNPITVLITISESSTSDWADFRDRIASALEAAEFEYVAVEIGRGTIRSRSFEKDSRILPPSSYELKARGGNSIGVRGSADSAGTFGCFLRLKKNNQWKTLGLTCHHVVLPSTSTHPSAHFYELYGIRPEENPTIFMDMPSLLDHQETTESYKATIEALQTKEHEIIGRKTADSSDFVIPSERRVYDGDSRIIAQTKLHLSRAEEFFALGHQNFGKVWAASGLRQAYPPSTPAHSFDWALITIPPTRMGLNCLPTFEEAPLQVRSRFSAWEETMFLHPRAPVHDEYLFIRGRSTGVSMGMYAGSMTTLLQSWKLDSQGHLRKTITREHSIAPISGLRSTDSLYFGRAGDSGSAVFTRQGGFVGLFFAGNDLSGTSYFTTAEDLFADIQKMTRAETVELA